MRHSRRKQNQTPSSPSANAEVELSARSTLDSTVYDSFDRLRFPLIVLVIYIHNAAVQVSTADGRIGLPNNRFAQFVIDFISNGIARTAVPLFFFMSGFLFFYKSKLNTAAYFQKLKSRFHTLLIPFLFWNFVNLLFYGIAQSNSLTGSWFSGTVPTLTQLSATQLVDRSLGIHYLPIAYQFWFIRDLMILVVLTPLVLLSVRAVGQWVAIALAILWVSARWPLALPEVEPTFFFYLGCYCAIRDVPVLAVGVRWRRFAVVALIMFVVSALQLFPWMSRLAQCFGILLALGAALGWSSLQPEWVARPLANLSRVSFFTFAVHEPSLQIARKLLYSTIPLSVSTAMAIYILLPLFITGFSLMIFALARRIAPQLLAIATGKRA